MVSGGAIHRLIETINYLQISLIGGLLHGLKLRASAVRDGGGGGDTDIIEEDKGILRGTHAYCIHK